MLIAYTKPPATESRTIENYAVVDLNKEPEEIRDDWLRCLGRLRYWCFNTTNNRFMFGNEAHRSAMIPEGGHFFIYLLYKEKCICLVIEGSTLYLVGFVTSSLGNIIACEMSTQGKQMQYIGGARKMTEWYGNYKKPEEVDVGSGPLRSSFRGMWKYLTGEAPQISTDDLYKCCDTFVIHFPEASRFDSLALCSIYHRFLDGGKIGRKQAKRVQNWSSDCRGALQEMTPVEIDESKEKTKSAKRKGIKSADSLNLVVKRSQKKTEAQNQMTVKDVRLFYRPDPKRITVHLPSMPFQLRDGEVTGNFPEHSREEIENMKFLMKSVHEFSHDACDYLDGEWKCKGLDAYNKEHTVGLHNLGNTCYVNSTLQCLHSVPELKSALLSYPDAARGNDIDRASHNLTLATSNVFDELDDSFQPVAPKQFLEALHKSNPKFAHLRNNVYMQQDADECWEHLVNTISQTLTSGSSEFTTPPMKELFGVDLVNRVQCAESGEQHLEDPESLYSLKCHVSQNLDHIHEGLEHGLRREFKRHSPRLHRSAIYFGQAKIDELPRYLKVKFERLIWKEESNRNVKITQKVEYPVELDVYDFCSDELKQKLHALRQMLSDPGNEASTLKTHEKGSCSKENEGSSSATAEQPSDMDIDKVERCVPKKQLTGRYNLLAVLSHKGSGEFGHYVSWVKQDDGKWVKFDDVHTSIHKEEDILGLCGGGDDHMAYICLYKGHMSE